MGTTAKLRRVRVPHGDVPAALAEGGGRSIAANPEVEARVREIVLDVQSGGDAAVARWTERIESRSPREHLTYEIPRSEIAASLGAIDDELRRALQRAAGRIRAFHAEQSETAYSIADGALRLRVEPLKRAGLYVPGGTARYPSSVLMTAIPARVAGVREIIMVTPGASQATLAASAIAGVDRVFEIGGAQAVAALAYGTETVPRVDIIVGPGNQWVAAAKRMVFGDVDIDSIAGPSEIMILADESAEPAWIAADLLAQAEHDTCARPLLVTCSEALAAAVDIELERQLETLPRAEIARASIENHGLVFLCESISDGIELANVHAPEHLEVLTHDAEKVAQELRSAGAIFVGPYSPEAAGDYLAGPNHVLPTGGAARYASPLGVYDFRKRTSVLCQSRSLLAEQRDDIARMARIESLEGHARSVEQRFAAESSLGSSRDEDRGGNDEGVREEINLASRLLRPELASIAPYRVEHPSGIRVALHANEMPASLPKAIAAGLYRFVSEIPLHRYPDSRATALREVLGQWLASSADGAIDEQRLVLGNGSDELILLLCSALAYPRFGSMRAKVLYPVPTFSVFRTAAATAGIETVEVPLDARFELDEAGMTAALQRDRPNLVFLARPNNPTGTLWERDVIKGFAASHPETLFIVDEAYIHYGGDTMVDEVSDNLAVMGTLSKIGLAGARIGYVYGSADLAAALERARPPYNIGGLNQAAAEYLLGEHDGWIAGCCSKVIAERERVRADLAGYSQIEVLPSSANLLLVRVANGSVGRGHALWRALAERGVLVRDLDREGALAGCIRITIGSQLDNDALLQAFSAVLG